MPCILVKPSSSSSVPTNDKKILFVVVVLLVVVSSYHTANAWTPSPINHKVLSSRQSQNVLTSSSLEMAKRKRRRKDGPDSSASSSSSSPSSSSSSSVGGELPDFELPEEMAAPPKAKVVSSNPDEISDAMMGSAMGSVRSVKDLIKDREIEKKFVFDDDDSTSEQLPDLPGIPQPNKKAARKQAAMERAAAEEAEMKLEAPGFLKNEKGEVTALKVRKKNQLHLWLMLCY
jgi:hypothetical protein